MRFLGILTLLIVAGAATAFAVLRNGEEDLAPMYQLATVTQRDIVVTANAPGTVEPIRTVEVRSKASGEIFDDGYDLLLPPDIPADRYPVHVGMYDPGTGERIPVWIDGARQPHDALLLGWITVE